MRYNVKTSLWTAGVLAAMALTASAASPEPLEVTADDLIAAGVPGVIAVEPAGDRYAPPVRYFRSPETLPENEGKKDCDGCGDLIAVYAVETPSVPSWNADARQQFIKVGGRLQLRSYIPSRKRIVTVTAPTEQTMRKISKHLVDKFSR